MPFTVDRVQRVDEQIRALAKRAKARGIRGIFVDALLAIVNQLENRPLEWGDPEYHTKQPGGVVCHGIVDPLFVRFVGYETHQVVVIIDILPMPKSRLESS